MGNIQNVKRVAAADGANRSEIVRTALRAYLEG